MQSLPFEVYQKQKDQHERMLATLRKKQSLLGWLRLGLILVTGVIAFYAFAFSLAAGWIAIIVGVAAFLSIVSVDVNNTKQLNNEKTLLSINNEELKMLNEDFQHRENGNEFAPAQHDYANDLDLFGASSLYQFINRCYTEQGKRLFAENLLQPLAADEVLARHEAIRELAPLFKWRQQLQAFAAQVPVTIKTQLRTKYWIENSQEQFSGEWWKWIILAYTTFTIATAVATMAGYIPVSIFSFLFLCYFITAGVFSRKAMPAYLHLNGIVGEISVIFQLMQFVEKKEFNSPLLKSLKHSVMVDGSPAFVQIGKLKDILNRFDLRLNVFLFLILNSFLLWDLRQMRALNSWRRKNQVQVSQWFELLAKFEVINSLATLHFNKPQWVFPILEERHFHFSGTGIGHPLIPAGQRIVSDFSLVGEGRIALVTGSNMAGKSTFLRSLGVNIVLAQIGSVVCARQMQLSLVKLMSSMRIADNLAENTSTFYAELKKIKSIIEAVGRKEPLFILLDEILRGTNSLDRHTGSKALIRQLIRQHAVAVIATHDVELSKLQELYPGAIDNYHFDVQVEGEELYFDYKLKQGVCTSLNASVLMKKIGIEI